jgi:beta-aspartyl-dipeptidase (metallo-type)
MRAFVAEHGFALERVTPLAIANTARVLKLDLKGRLEQDCDADALVLRRDTLEIAHVFVSGKPEVRDGELVFMEKFLTHSDRRISLYGGKS